MAVSTIPAFKAALLARLQADAGLSGVQITYGHPYPLQPADEMVFLGNSVGANPTLATNAPAGQSSAAIGQYRREERYTLDVFASVHKHNREIQKTVTERAFAIAGVVETSLRVWTGENPAFGGVVRWALVTGLDHVETVDVDNRYADVHIVVACAARI